MALAAIPVLKPDFVMVVLTSMERREYPTPHGNTINFYRTALENLPSQSEIHFNKDNDEMVRSLDRLWNPWHNLDDFLRHYHTIKIVLQSFNIPWGFGCMGANHLANYVHELVTAGYLDKEFYLGHAFEPIDVIADGGHPGPKAHDNFAREVDEWMSKKYEKQINNKIYANINIPGDQSFNIFGRWLRRMNRLFFKNRDVWFGSVATKPKLNTAKDTNYPLY
jgi:hypothetical protein